MSHTPSPTVIEEARKMAEGLKLIQLQRLLAAIKGEDTPSIWGEDEGDDAPLVHAFIAAIELGERRAEAARRYITTWRKPPPNVLDWSHHASEDEWEAAQVVANLKAQGVHQFHTFRLGEMLPKLSSEY